ncbi:MAG: cytochrome c3 family protein [Gammaproteobacteria bacterium]|nr:cytochrome c3 family protein [Gammaproteobacteria bacterium]
MNADWEIAQAFGVASVALCLMLCVLSVRPRSGANQAFSLRSHEWLGWLALAAALLHVGCLIATDPVVIEHLKPTAPRYELAGMLALGALAFLVLAGHAPIRQRLWLRHRNFQAAHVGAACLLVWTTAAHVVTTDRYVHGASQRAAYLLLSAVALLALLRPRSSHAQVRQTRPVLASLVFGRHSAIVLAIVLGSLGALLPLDPSGAIVALREPFLRRDERLVVDFPHDLHRAINCIQCHHNYTDGTGGDSCVACHRSRRTDLRVGVEARFHTFCLGCHRDPPGGLSGHGPVTGCRSCHAPLAAGRE